MKKNNQNIPPHRENRDELPFRPGVGLVIFNPAGLVFVGERLDNPGKWQMPQGGIDPGEDIETAALREMEEEVGTRNARIMGIMQEWLFYDIPEHISKRLWDGKYRGQKQKWVALEFLGSDADIDVEASDHPEFRQWRWMTLQEMLGYVVPFKREVYERVIEEFGDIAAELAYAAKSR